jgi:K+-transporting ATPase ATPase B chain
MAAARLRERSLLVDPEILRPAIWESFRKLAPQKVIRNPVMFVVEVGSVLTTLILIRDLVAPTAGSQSLWFTFNVSFWLWFTVVFANFAEAVAEGRGKAQAATLRKMRQETNARRLVNGQREEVVPASALRKGDTVVSRPAKLPVTATRSEGSRPSMSRRSPVNPRRHP